MGILPMHRRAVPDAQRRCGFGPASAGETLVILMGGTPMLLTRGHSLSVSGMIGSQRILSEPRRVPVATAMSTSEIW